MFWLEKNNTKKVYGGKMTKKLQSVLSIINTIFDSHKKLVLIIGGLLLSIVLGLFDLENTQLILLIIISVYIFICIKDIYLNYVNWLTIFFGFHILYGLIGPISYLWIGGFPQIYGNNINVSVFLIAYAIATIGLIVGFTLSNNTEIEKNVNRNKYIINTSSKKLFIKYICVFFCFVTLIGELINFFRAGGFVLLTTGKAIYQSAVGDLFLTIPTNYLFVFTIALCCICGIVCGVKKNIKLFIADIIILSPFILLKMLFGQRGILLSAIVIIFLAYSYKKPIKFITKKLVIICMCCYFGLSFLYVTRSSIKYLFSDVGKFAEIVFSKKNIGKVLNPGSNEFSCGLGNFNALYRSTNYDYLYGESYIRGLTSFIPGYLYPGEKKVSITFQFRDTYFPTEKERARIAGTAFSSIMEAYWNFGFFGIFFMYSIYGLIICMFEKCVRKKNFIYLIVYFSLSPIFITFHRSSMGSIFNDIIMKLFLLLFVYIVYYYLQKNRFVYLVNINNYLKEQYQVILRKFYEFVHKYKRGHKNEE